MTLPEEQRKVQEAMKRTLSGLQEDPWLTQRVLQNAKGETPMAKKLSASMILVIILVVLSMSAALAAGLGLFGELSKSSAEKEKLNELDHVAANVAASYTSPDGVTVELMQAYYEGTRVFLSYRISGNLVQTALHEGAPDSAYPWMSESEHYVVAEKKRSDDPQTQEMNQWLNGAGQRWCERTTIGLHDGLFLADGTYLDIYDGEDIPQPDGSIIGWKECEIPENRLDGTLTFKAVLYSFHTILFQDYTTYREYHENGNSYDIPFTLRRYEHCTYLFGTSKQPAYQATAAFAAGLVDLKGVVQVVCPAEWVQVWESWESKAEQDTIMQWNLYQNGRLISKEGTQGITVTGERALRFDLAFPHLDKLDGLTLVPEYFGDGERPEEAIAIASDAVVNQ